MADRLKAIYAAEKFAFIFTVDSRGLYSTITTLHEGADYRLRPTVSRLRDSFENGEIDHMQWIAGTKNLADALTKRNFSMFRQLNEVMKEGLMKAELFEHAKRVSFNEN